MYFSSQHSHSTTSQLLSLSLSENNDLLTNHQHLSASISAPPLSLVILGATHLHICSSTLPNAIFASHFAGNAISVLVFAAPLPTFYRIFKSKSTQEFNCLPYVCTLLSTSIWTYYGLIKPHGTLIFTINAAGTLFEVIYVLLFLIFSPKDKKVQTWLLVFLLNIMLFGIVLILTMLLIPNSFERVLVVGVLGATISVSMYAAPLVAMKTVIRTRSVEYMPLPMSLFLFLNAIVWTAYAILVKDIFVEIPNGIGVVLGASQLILYFMYKKKDETRKGSGKMKELNSFKDYQSPTNHKDMDRRDGNNSLSNQHSIPKVNRSTSSNLSKMINIMDEDSSIRFHEKTTNKTNA